MALLDNAFYIKGNTTILPIDLGSSNNAAGATLTLTGVTVPANSLVCVAVSEAVAVTAGTLSDGTHSYTKITSELMSTSVGIGVLFYYFYASPQSGLTLTYTKGGTGDKCSMAAFYATGINSTTPVDSAVTAVAQSTSATPTITSGVPTQSGDLIVAMVAYDYSSAEALTNAGPFAAPFDNVTTQTTAQLGGGNLNVAGSLAVTYAPTIAHAPTGAALIIAGFAPAATYTGWWDVTPWSAAAGATAGSLTRQNATLAVGNERVFVCYNSTSGTGTTGATEPTWVITRGGQVTDNSGEVGGVHRRRRTQRRLQFDQRRDECIVSCGQHDADVHVHSRRVEPRPLCHRQDCNDGHPSRRDGGLIHGDQGDAQRCNNWSRGRQRRHHRVLQHADVGGLSDRDGDGHARTGDPEQRRDAAAALHGRRRDGCARVGAVLVDLHGDRGDH